jgi:hypothetical protein
MANTFTGDIGELLSANDIDIEDLLADESYEAEDSNIPLTFEEWKAEMSRLHGNLLSEEVAF